MKFITSISVTFLAALVTGIAVPNVGAPDAAAASLEKRLSELPTTVYCHNNEGFCDRGSCVVPTGLSTHKIYDDAACKNTTNSKL